MFRLYWKNPTNRSIFIFLVIIINIFFFTVLCWADQKIESKIGPFNFDGSLMMESKLISSYGKGYVKADKADGMVFDKKHIYYIPDQKVWVEIRLSDILDKNLERSVESILITKKKLCDEKFNPKESFGLLITGKGIKIGDTYDKTISMYGTPSIYVNVDKDKSFAVLREYLKLQTGRVLRYLPKNNNSLLAAEFYFVGTTLHSVLISTSE